MTPYIFITIFSSYICSTLFISTIVILALVTHRKSRHPPKTTSHVDAYANLPPPTIALSDVAKALDLSLKTYNITTDDGFIISIHRLYNETFTSLPKGKPVLFIHGLLQSSASFLTSGKKSLAYTMIINGHDVWLGENRCGFHPKHINYTINNHKMWDWDIHEMAHYDIPSMINHILSNSTHDKINIISHSQGTTQCIYLFSNQFGIPSYSQYVDNCILLAPAIYGGPLLNTKHFIKFMRFLPNSIFDFFFGLNSFMPILIHLRNQTYNWPYFGDFSYMVFNYLFNWNDKLWDNDIKYLHFMFSPVYISTKLMKWWLRGIDFKLNTPIINEDSNWFNQYTPNLLLIIGNLDDLVNGNLFIKKLQKETIMTNKWDYKIIDGYSHLDVIWADDVIDVIGKPILEFFKNK